jgi:hypothetical protein
VYILRLSFYVLKASFYFCEVYSPRMFCVFFVILSEPLVFLGFVLSRTFYASAILNEPLAFWALFLLERCTLP